MNLENFLAKYGFHVENAGASRVVFYLGNSTALREIFSLTDYSVSSVTGMSVWLIPKA